MSEPTGQPDQAATAQTDAQQNQQGGTQQQQSQQQPQQQSQQPGDTTPAATTKGSKAVSWFTETFLRAGIAIIGVVLLLVAVGQMAGVDTFSIVGSILSSNLAQWAAVAIFGLLLVVAASKSWTFVAR